MRPLVSLALLAAACGGGDGAPPDAPILIDADDTVDTPPPREVHMSVQTLMGGGELVEAKMVGGEPGAGDRAIITLTAPTPTLDWNIHAHPDGSTVTVHEELDVMDVRFDFIPAEQAEWFLLLRNGGNVTMSVEVKIELYGAMTFDFI